MNTSNPADSSDSRHSGALRRPGLPRRQFLAQAGTAGVGAFAVSAGLGTPGALAATHTGASMRRGAATGMPGLREVWQWEEQLVRFGTRYTGSPGHVAYVDWLAGQLSAVPGFSMRTDRLTFNRWLPRQFALQVSVVGTEKLFLTGWLAVMVLLTLATLRLPFAFTALFTLVDVAVLLVLLGTVQASTGLLKAGGYVALVFAAIGAYIWVGSFFNATGGKEFPLGTPVLH